MEIVDGKYQPVSRRTVTSKMIPELVTALESRMKDMLKDLDFVSTTVDIWSDRTMRGYLGVTAHGMVNAGNGMELKSFLLACSRYVL